MRKHHAMPAFDLESIHKAFLARIFKTKIEIFSSMIYKIALERWGRTQYNKNRKAASHLVTGLENICQGAGGRIHEWELLAPITEIPAHKSY